MTKLEQDYEILGRILAHVVKEGLGTAEFHRTTLLMCLAAHRLT
jgi:hypothetical protein